MANKYYKKRETKEEYAKRMKDNRDKMFQLGSEAVQTAVSNDDSFRTFLNVQSQFNKMSVINQALIAKQFPEATQLKSYEEWSEAGTQVKRKEHSISILEPSTYTDKDGNERVSYNEKKVFDVSQTTSYHPSKERVYSIEAITKAVMEASRVPCVAVDELPVEGTAFYNVDANSVMLTSGDSVQLFKDLVREEALVEFAYNDKEYDREKLLPLANCVVYTICGRYNIEADDIDISKARECMSGKEEKDIRADMNKCREALKVIDTDIYIALNKDKEPRNQDMER